MEIKINDQTGKVTVMSKKAQTIYEQGQTLGQGESVIVEKDNSLDKKIVANLVKTSNRIIASISTHRFPFDLFPDTLNVEDRRVTIINRSFFLSSQIHSVDIKDISNVFVNTAPFFAQLVIVSKTFTRNETRIRYLRKDEAIYIRRIIEGLRIFLSKQIDTSIYSTKELISKLKELSTTKIVT